MSILINGMEIPTSCQKCPFLDYEEGFCFASGTKGKSGWYEFTLRPGEIKDGRHDDCPLVNVPPHGDLIERKAVYLTDFEIAMCNGDYKEGMKMLLKKIESAPTIIPAEEGE